MRERERENATCHLPSVQNVNLMDLKVPEHSQDKDIADGHQWNMVPMKVLSNESQHLADGVVLSFLVKATRKITNKTADIMFSIKSISHRNGN